MENLAKDTETVIRGLLTSSKFTMTVRKLNQEYRDIEGRYIPYSQLGFQSLDQYLRSLGGVLQVMGQGDHAEVRVFVSEKSAHVRDLIDRQRVPKTKRNAKNGIGRANRSFRPAVDVLANQCSVPYNSYSVNIPYYNAQYGPSVHPAFNQAYYNNYSLYKPMYSNTSYRPTNDGCTLQKSASNTSYKTSYKPPEVKLCTNEGAQKAALDFSLSNTIRKTNHADTYYKMASVTSKQIVSEPPPTSIHSTSCKQPSDSSDNLSHSAVPPSTSTHSISLKKLPDTSDKPSESDSNFFYFENSKSDSKPKLKHDSAEVSSNSHSYQTARSLCNQDVDNKRYSEATASESFHPVPRRSISPSPSEDEVYISDEEQPNTKVPQVVQDNLRKLISKQPDGIWCTKIPDLYTKEYGTNLDYTDYGYQSLQHLCMDLRNAFNCIQPDHGDYKVFDKNRPVPADLLRIIKRVEYFRTKEAAAKEATESALPETGVEELLMNVHTSNAPLDIIKYGKFVDKQWIDSSVRLHSYVDVNVGEIYDPSKFWINLSAIAGNLNALMDDMQQFYKMNAKFYEAPQLALRTGLYISVMFLEEYHRAVVVDPMIDTEGLIKVLFIDYGTVSLVRSVGVCYLHEKFGALPAQAIRARLAGIYPPVRAEQWTRKSSERFLTLVKNKDLVAQVTKIDKEKEILELILADTSDEEDFFINDALVFDGFAEFTSQEQRESKFKRFVPIVRFIHLFPTFDELELGMVPTAGQMITFDHANIGLECVYPHYFRDIEASLDSSLSDSPRLDGEHKEALNNFWRKLMADIGNKENEDNKAEVGEKDNENSWLELLEMKENAADIRVDESVKAETVSSSGTNPYENGVLRKQCESVETENALFGSVDDQIDERMKAEIISNTGKSGWWTGENKSPNERHRTVETISGAQRKSKLGGPEILELLQSKADRLTNNVLKTREASIPKEGPQVQHTNLKVAEGLTKSTTAVINTKVLQPPPGFHNASPVVISNGQYMNRGHSTVVTSTQNNYISQMMNIRPIVPPPIILQNIQPNFAFVPMPCYPNHQQMLAQLLLQGRYSYPNFAGYVPNFNSSFGTSNMPQYINNRTHRSDASQNSMPDHLLDARRNDPQQLLKNENDSSECAFIENQIHEGHDIELNGPEQLLENEVSSPELAGTENRICKGLDTKLNVSDDTLKEAVENNSNNRVSTIIISSSRAASDAQISSDVQKRQTDELKIKPEIPGNMKADAVTTSSLPESSQKCLAEYDDRSVSGEGIHLLDLMDHEKPESSSDNPAWVVGGTPDVIIIPPPKDFADMLDFDECENVKSSSVDNVHEPGVICQLKAFNGTAWLGKDGSAHRAFLIQSEGSKREPLQKQTDSVRNLLELSPEVSGYEDVITPPQAVTSSEECVGIFKHLSSSLVRNSPPVLPQMFSDTQESPVRGDVVQLKFTSNSSHRSSSCSEAEVSDWEQLLESPVCQECTYKSPDRSSKTELNDGLDKTETDVNVVETAKINNVTKQVLGNFTVHIVTHNENIHFILDEVTQNLLGRRVPVVQVRRMFIGTPYTISVVDVNLKKCPELKRELLELDLIKQNSSSVNVVPVCYVPQLVKVLTNDVKKLASFEAFIDDSIKLLPSSITNS